MSQLLPPPVTPYQQQVYNALAHLKAERWNCARPQDVAEAMGRSVTPSLRRRLKEAAAAGYVHEFRYYTPAGGLATAYWLETQLPLPDMPGLPF